MAARRRNVSRGARRTLTVTALLGAVTAAGVSSGARMAGAQTRPATVAAPDTTDPLARALDAEDRNDAARATVAYREVLQRALQPGNTDGDRVALALLGLERMWAERGMLDSLVPVFTRVLQVRPGDPTARTVQLRTFVSMARDADARDAFTMWRRVAGADATPYREYSRLLMQQGRTLAADSILSEAAQRMGAAGALSGETAQLHVALQRWVPAAQAYREALADQPWLETAALFGLQRAPATVRDSLRTVLLAAPVTLPPRRLLSSLEFAWGEPRKAWTAISTLTANDSTTQAWRAFGERAELNESWLVARDAWTAVFEKTGDAESQQRAADAALRAGDADGALAMVRRARSSKADTSRARALLSLEIAALGELGRGDEAQRKLDDAAKRLDPDTRIALTRPLVAAWLRAGDVARARTMMQAGDLADDDEMAGWLALYDGDLVSARKRLLRAASNRPELVDALGILARTRVEQLPGLGEAFVLVARKDSAAAAARFTRLADSVGGAAPAFIAQAARLSPRAAAVPLYERIVRDFPRSPEAPEALLTWARALRDAGDKAGAITRLEQLMVEYPTSALTPQGRRDLERLKGMVPPI